MGPPLPGMPLPAQVHLYVELEEEISFPHFSSAYPLNSTGCSADGWSLGDLSNVTYIGMCLSLGRVF